MSEHLSLNVSLPAETALTFPAEHPAVKDPSSHRQPFSGVAVDFRERTIRMERGGWIDGPATIGAAWRLEA